MSIIVAGCRHVHLNRETAGAVIVQAFMEYVPSAVPCANVVLKLGTDRARRRVVVRAIVAGEPGTANNKAAGESGLSFVAPWGVDTQQDDAHQRDGDCNHLKDVKTAHSRLFSR